MFDLDVAVVALGHKGHVDGKEVIRLSCHTELQTARLIVGIDHWETPLQDISPTVMFVLTVQVPDHWGPDTRPKGIRINNYKRLNENSIKK